MDNTTITKKIALAIIKNTNGEVLIIKRKLREIDKSGPEVTWVFPGGTIEPTETELEAAVRQTLIETGHKVKAQDVISRRVFPNSTVFVHYVVCELTSDEVSEITATDKVETYKWVKPQEIKDHFTSDLDKVVAVYLGLI
ncbi:MAG TPA: NUDIX hydrolase [Candidatus Saccharimonadales bacterium]|nr:NUDIX hydrolase [Candidatus Saccharimonadales bacterium]